MPACTKMDRNDSASRTLRLSFECQLQHKWNMDHKGVLENGTQWMG